ncbi:S41 family peptidase [Olivibacter sp. SDN3]|uniref:S41 family peptidase n=1 Tax=Olivibacter sp. SDN3 TaxID=2764720 RepID=UPI001650FF45|nr:S41 family peptidase [Olivibacter sp. SDN3]QNL51207.1 S41 family peptidase [Olivibacter sp. SDN3]
MRQIVKFTGKVKISLGIIGALLLTAFTISKDGLFDVGKNLEIFSALYRQINVHYVENIDTEDLMKTGINAMLNRLDPYTEFIPESDLEDFKLRYVSTKYSGLGAKILTKKDGSVYIAEIYEGYPAHRSGLRSGDRIISIDGEQVKGKSAQEISHLLKGNEYTNVDLEIQRADNDELVEKQIERANIIQPNISYFSKNDQGIGYIKLDKFLTGAYEEMYEALADLQEEKGIKGLVLDLRDNGGGILQESVKIVNLFVNKGEHVVTQKGKQLNKQIAYITNNTPILPDVPLVILINEYSASASEIVAGALQDMDRAVVMGQRSFGKGLVQQTYRLPYNNMVKVTVAKYYTPSGRCIQALDYAHKDAYGFGSKMDDSLITEFKTKNGRKVYNGNGIFPDITLEEEKLSPIAQKLLNELIIFDYATLYYNTHKRVNKAADFSLSEDEYQSFTDYLIDLNFHYNPNSEKLLEQLRLAIDEEGKTPLLEEELAVMKEKLNNNDLDELQFYKAEIKGLLEKEIVSRYYYQKGRYEYAMRHDNTFLAAEDILVAEEKQLVYCDVLEGKGSFRTIGKPNVHLASSETFD